MCHSQHSESSGLPLSSESHHCLGEEKRRGEQGGGGEEGEKGEGRGRGGGGEGGEGGEGRDEKG